MKASNPDLEKSIREKALDLLMVKEPEEIGMREIARACGVTPPTIYYYFKDKDCLFVRVKQDCIASMDARMLDAISRGTGPLESLKLGLEAFRDWAFDNPRIAVLIMGRFKPDTSDIDEALRQNYRSMTMAVSLLEDAAKAGLVSCSDPVLAVSLCVYSLWGVIESFFSKRTFPQFWDRGRELTDASIRMCLNYIACKGESK